MDYGKELIKTIQLSGHKVDADFNYNWLPDDIKDKACIKLLELNQEFHGECIPGAAMWPELAAMYLSEPDSYCQRLRNNLMARALIYSECQRCGIEEALAEDSDMLACEAGARLEYHLGGLLYLLFKDQTNFLMLCKLAIVKYLNPICETEIFNSMSAECH